MFFLVLWALIYKVEKIDNGQFWVGIEMNIPKDAHVYSKETSSTGMPTEIMMDNANVVESIFVNPEKKKMGDKTALIHKNKLKILIRVASNEFILRGHLQYLLCGNVCTPKNEPVVIDLTKTSTFDHKEWLTEQKEHKHHALWWMLVLAFVGGVFLNFMPCVLPLLSIKALSFCSKNEHPFKVGLFYAGGIVFSFLTLGLVLSIFKASYGFQMQSSYFVFALCLLFLGISLHLFGFINMPFYAVSLTVPSIRSQYLESFVSGVITTVVATPCCGPYMGMVLGYSLTQSVFYILLVFLFLGVGFSFPMLFLILFSKLTKYVPKYFEGMEVMKKISAFMCLITVLWFLYVLSNFVDIETVFLLMGLLVLISFGAFFKINIIIMAGILGGFYLLHTQKYIENTPAIVVDLNKIQKPALLVFTAKWCLNCVVNKKTIQQYEYILKKKGIQLVFVDVTKEFPPLFKKYNAPGVPFNVFIKENGEEIVLPENLTRNDLAGL